MNLDRSPRTIDKIRAAQRSLRKPHTVKEWGITLFFPPMTYAARNAVAAHMGDKPEDVQDDVWKRREWVTLIASVAENEDGSKAFDLGDVDLLIETASAAILDQLVGVMFLAGVPDMPKTVEEGKVDSETTPTSTTE